jgi:hypothetical protein
LIVAEQFSIRRATRDDAQSIARFNQVMARETEGKELNPERVLAGVYGLLEKPELGFYLVATHEDRIAGSLMVTYEWSDWRCGSSGGFRVSMWFPNSGVKGFIGVYTPT